MLLLGATDVINVLKIELVEGTQLELVQEAVGHVTNAVPGFCEGVLQSFRGELITIVFDDMMIGASTMLSSCLRACLHLCNSKTAGDELVFNGLQTLQEGGASAESTSIQGMIGPAVVGYEVCGPHLTHLLKAQKHVFVANSEAESITAELESTVQGSWDKCHFDVPEKACGFGVTCCQKLPEDSFFQMTEDVRDRILEVCATA